MNEIWVFHLSTALLHPSLKHQELEKRSFAAFTRFLKLFSIPVIKAIQISPPKKTEKLQFDCSFLFYSGIPIWMIHCFCTYMEGYLQKEAENDKQKRNMDILRESKIGYIVTILTRLNGYKWLKEKKVSERNFYHELSNYRIWLFAAIITI